MLRVLLHGGLEEENGVGDVALLQTLETLLEGRRVLLQRVVLLKLVLLHSNHSAD